MLFLDRRQAMKLASSFAAAFPLLKSAGSRAHGETPNSGIFIGRSRNAEISNNSVARGRIAKAAVAVDRTCVRESVRLTNNALT
jgi:hypothetical protein